MAAFDRLALILRSQSHAAAASALRHQSQGDTDLANELNQVAEHLDRLAKAVDDGEVTDILIPLGAGPEIDDEDEAWRHLLGSIVVSAGFGDASTSVTLHNASWCQLESGWQLDGWIREKAADHWNLYEADNITVAYEADSAGDPNVLVETLKLVRRSGPGTRYGDGRGAFTRFLVKFRPERMGGEDG